jgi:predicted RNA binding protein YcfA (HicA-like mRNA interferase family)
MDAVSARLLEDVAAEAMPPRVLLGYVFAFLSAIVGAIIGAYSGWLYGEGMVPIIWSFVGFVVGYVTVWIVGGPLAYHYQKFKLYSVPPSYARLNAVGFTEFDLYVTIHKIQNMYNSLDPIGIFGSDNALNYYVEVKAGRKLGDGGIFQMLKNAAKRTCTNNGGVFEEMFHFIISPTDNTLRITVKDQDLFDEFDMGYADINITNQIVNQGFPQKRAFKLTAGKPGQHVVYTDAHHQTGTIIVSFTPGKTFPQHGLNTIAADNKFSMQGMVKERETILSDTKEHYQAYDTFATITPQR